MKKIPDEYIRKPFTCTLIRREKHVALYSQTHPEGKTKRYEVVVVRTRTKDNDFTGTKAGDEYLPSPEEWGTYGWTYTSIEDAEERVKELLSRTALRRMENELKNS